MAQVVEALSLAAESDLWACISGTEAAGWTGVVPKSGSHRPLRGRRSAHPRTSLLGVGPLRPAQTGRRPPDSGDWGSQGAAASSG